MIVEERFTDVYTDFDEILDGKTVKDAIRKLSEIEGEVTALAKSKYGDGFIEAFFKTRHYGYDGGSELDIWIRRRETDKERDDRLAAAEKKRQAVAKRKATLENKERAELARLQKKYGA